MNAPVIRESSGWVGRLELCLERVGEKTVLGRRAHVGPLYVQRAFYPEGGDLVHLYLLHPPGGVVGGDCLETRVSLGEGARGLLTTPAAQKLYRSAGPESTLETQLTVAAGATLEWLPSETIVFDGARATQGTRIELEPGAALLGWEITCFGRPANRIRFERGRLRLGLELWRGATPLLVERLSIEGGSRVLDEAWGFGTAPLSGTLYAVPSDASCLPELVTRVRELGPRAGVQHAVTSLGEALVVRALGAGLEPLRALFVAIWETLRPRVIGRPPARPRIWAT